MAIAPQMSTTTRQVDVVALERGRGDLGHRPRRQALEARREGRADRRPSFRRPALPVEHGHARLPALVVHRTPECSRGRGARGWRTAQEAPPASVDRRRRRSGRTSEPRAGCRTCAWRSGSASASTRRDPSRPAGAAPRRGRGRRRSARRRAGSAAPGTGSTGRSRPARGGAAGRSGCSARCPAGASPSSPKRRGAVEQRLDDEQAPAVADPVEGALRAATAAWRRRRGRGARASARDGSRAGACHRSRVSSNLQVTVTHHSQPYTTETTHAMSAIEEIATAVARVAEHVGPSIVGIGRARPRGRRRHRRRPGPDQRPQPARRRGHRHVRRRALDARHRRPASTPTATSRSSTVDTAGATPDRRGATATRSTVGDAVFGAAATPRRRRRA